MSVLERDELSVRIALRDLDVALGGALEGGLRLHLSTNVSRGVRVLLLLQRVRLHHLLHHLAQADAK